MRRLRGDLPRLWADHRGSLGRQYRSHYQALADRLGPFVAQGLLRPVRWPGLRRVIFDRAEVEGLFGEAYRSHV